MKAKSGTEMNRRTFLKSGALSAGAFAGFQFLPQTAQGAKESKQPNIIFIMTDQQHAGMMSCADNPNLQTPAMDYIAENGIRFTRAYSTNPVCSPARVGLMTGRFPGVFMDEKGHPARENDGSMRIPEVSDEVRNNTIAAHLQSAGYELVYGGKEHLPKPLTPSRLGFKDITDNERDQLADAAADYIRGEHRRPYFMWLSFINPHDICYYALRRLTFEEPGFPPDRRLSREEKTLLEALQRPEGISDEEFLQSYCPNLPANYEPQQDEPQAISMLLEERPFRMNARRNYTEKDWRLHRWAYCRLTEMVDRQIQTVLDALQEVGQEENTLVIFSSDHGDLDSAHRMEHKTALYEEAANVPFTAMWKGRIPAGRIDNEHLVSNGLDLLPTVCDYAGVEGRADPRGRTLRPLLEGKRVNWRKTLGVESQIGRMVVDEHKCKYIRYDFAPGEPEEQLLDLNHKPLESKNYTSDPSYASKLAQLRESYDTEWFPEQREMEQCGGLPEQKDRK